MSIFNLSIKPTPSPCASTDYLFYIATPAQAAKEGESVSLTVVGGIGPYDWVSLSPGVSITDAQTTVLTNTLTIDALPWGGYAYYKVTDSCGTERVGAIGLWDDYSFDCHSVACEAASELLFSGPTVDVDTGSQYTASGGVAPYRYRVTHGAIDGTGQVVGFYDLASSTYQITVTVIDMCGNKKSIEATRLLPPIALSDNWILAPGESVSFLNYGCDDDMRYSISCGEIDKRTGEILSLDGCECIENVTVTGEDGCGQSDDSSQVNSSYDPAECECAVLTLVGTDAPVIGSQYTATGGSGVLTFSFDKGSFSVSGNVATITAIDSCGASGTDRTGTVSVSDSCDPAQTEEIPVRVDGGMWVVDYFYYPTSNTTLPSTATNSERSVQYDIERAKLRDVCCSQSEDFEDFQYVAYDGGDPWSSYLQPLFYMGAGSARLEHVYLDLNAALSGCRSGYNSCPFCAISDYLERAYAAVDCIAGSTERSSDADLVIIPQGNTTATLRYPNGSDRSYRVIQATYMKWVCP